jgi:hypothetical protein
MSTLSAKLALTKTQFLPDVPTLNANLDAIDAAIAGATVQAVDGALAVAPSTVIVTKSTAAALTLAAPVAGTDDGKIIRVVSATAAAHVITGAVGFNGKNASGTATLGAVKGNSVSLLAYNGQWYVFTNIGATLA